MNLLIAFVILIVLMISELSTAHPVENVELRVLAVLLTTFMVPSIATFQTLLATRKFRQQDLEEHEIESSLRRLSASHTAVWLIASIAIVYSFQWQHLVRVNWGLDRFPLVDELLILAPVLLSLIASWAIFYDIQSYNLPKSKTGWLKRLGFVSIRVRVYLLVCLIPILFGMGFKDVLDSQAISSEAALWLISFVGLPILLASFPFLILVIWQTQTFTSTELKQEVIQLCNSQNLRVATVRIWKTNYQIVNALVAGVFPYFRVILLSDGIVELFSRRQLAAVLRHEAGHINRWHLPSRVFFIVLPIAIYFAADRLGANPTELFENVFLICNLDPSLAVPLLCLGYAAYLLATMSWLSHQMEYDADAYSFRNDQSANMGVDDEQAYDMAEALFQFGQLMPNHIDRRSLWHPTIRKRLIRIQQIRQKPQRLQELSDAFCFNQFVLAASVILAATFLLFIASQID